MYVVDNKFETIQDFRRLTALAIIKDLSKDMYPRTRCSVFLENMGQSYVAPLKTKEEQL